MKKLSEVLIEERGRKGLSQFQLAAAASVSQGQLSKLESGKLTNPGPFILRRLETALRLPVGFLYDIATRGGGL